MSISITLTGEPRLDPGIYTVQIDHVKFAQNGSMGAHYFGHVVEESPAPVAPEKPDPLAEIRKALDEGDITSANMWAMIVATNLMIADRLGDMSNTLTSINHNMLEPTELVDDPEFRPSYVDEVEDLG